MFDVLQGIQYGLRPDPHGWIDPLLPKS